jgi:hypothetical protein
VYLDTEREATDESRKHRDTFIKKVQADLEDISNGISLNL